VIHFAFRKEVTSALRTKTAARGAAQRHTKVLGGSVFAAVIRLSSTHLTRTKPFCRMAGLAFYG